MISLAEDGTTLKRAPFFFSFGIQVYVDSQVTIKLHMKSVESDIH